MIFPETVVPMTLNIAIVVVVGAVLLLALLLTALSLFSRRPRGVGLHDGALRPCPGTPNCVSSRAADETHRIEPLTFSAPPAEAWARLAEVIRSLPRSRIVERTDNYMHAEFTSALFRFVDDVEFLLDEPAGIIHVRSASRVGHADLGANRNRVETIRRLFAD